jgi:hypothetical protein
MMVTSTTESKRRQRFGGWWWLMEGVEFLILYCFVFFFWVGYELSKVFMIDNAKFVMVFLVGKTCVVWHCWMDLCCWMSIKNGMRLEFKYPRTFATWQQSIRIFFLVFWHVWCRLFCNLWRLVTLVKEECLKV